jgi:hypothetical protein
MFSQRNLANSKASLNRVRIRDRQKNKVGQNLNQKYKKLPHHASQEGSSSSQQKG